MVDDDGASLSSVDSSSFFVGELPPKEKKGSPGKDAYADMAY